MDPKDYRERVHNYVASMIFFRKMYEEGSITASHYELIEVLIANKYRIPRTSVFRLHLH